MGARSFLKAAGALGHGVLTRRPRRDIALALLETERTYETTLEALSKALHVRDHHTEEHAQRVVGYMELIARELALGPQDMTLLRRGALLHDIGKIGVPDQILRKDAPLTEREWRAMRKHPELGAGIIAGIPFLSGVSELVRHHHESWDGSGYPDGLAGDEIPLGVRVFSVADAFDAMTSDRPYRNALSVSEARAEVARCSGTQFDPAVVAAFMRIPLASLVESGAETLHGVRLLTSAAS